MKEKIVSLFLSKIDVAKFSEIIKRSVILSVPYKIIAQRLIDWKFPYHLFIETTNACNLKCKMCTRNMFPIQIGMMEQNLAKKIVDEAAQCGPRTFSLHLFGEPLMAPVTIPLIEYIKNKNKKNNILLTTNGVFLTEDIAKKIIENEVDKLIISIQGSTKEKYKEMTGTDQMDKVDQNIRRLVAIKKESGKKKPFIYLRIILPAGSSNDFKNFKKKWANYPVIPELREMHNFGGKIKEGERKLNKRYPCYHLWFSPGISWDGQVSICCCDALKEEIIGNVKEKSLSEIWQSEKLKKYREYHLHGQYDKITLCKDCNVWSSYPDIFFNYQKKKSEN